MQADKTHLVHFPKSREEFMAGLCEFVFYVPTQVFPCACGGVARDICRAEKCVGKGILRGICILLLAFIGIRVGAGFDRFPGCRVCSRGWSIELRDGLQSLPCALVVKVRAQDFVQPKRDWVTRRWGRWLC